MILVRLDEDLTPTKPAKGIWCQVENCRHGPIIYTEANEYNQVLVWPFKIPADHYLPSQSYIWCHGMSNEPDGQRRSVLGALPAESYRPNTR